MNKIINDFLANITSLPSLRVENLPKEIVDEMMKMETDELYKTCWQFVFLLNNVPSTDKVVNLDEDELTRLVENYAKDLLVRVRGEVS